MSKRTQSKEIQLITLGAGVVGVGFSIRRLITNRKDTDKLEQAAEVLGLAAAILGLIAAFRKMRRGD